MHAPTPRQINRLLIMPALAAALVIVAARGQGLSSRAVGQDASGASVIVDAFPDLAGEGAYWPDCPGCDGAFRAGDALLAEENPLPAVQVSLVDDSGEQVILTTRAMSEGRQQAIFQLDAAETVTVSLSALPDGWATCPERRDELVLVADDFSDGQARLEFALSPTCRPPGVAVTAEQAAQDEADEDEGEAQGAQSADEDAADDEADADETDADEADSEEVDDTDDRDDTDDADTDDGDDATPGAVRGLVYVDANEDGALEAGEAGLPDVQVYLDGEEDSRSALTDANGGFRFEDLDGLAYDVSIEVPEGWMAISGERYARLSVDGRELNGVSFGLARKTSSADDEEEEPTDEMDQEEVDQADESDREEEALAAEVDEDCPDDWSEPCDCDDELYPTSGPWIPMGGLPSTGFAGVAKAPGLGLAGVALMAGVLGMLGLAVERRRRPGARR